MFNEFGTKSRESVQKDEAMKPWSKIEYSKSKLTILKSFCLERKIENYTTKNKNEIIEMLLKYDEMSIHKSMSEELNININEINLGSIMKAADMDEVLNESENNNLNEFLKNDEIDYDDLMLNKSEHDNNFIDDYF